MLRNTLTIRKAIQTFSSYTRRQNAKRAEKSSNPFHQSAVSRENVVMSHLKKRVGINSKLDPVRAGKMTERMYGESVRMRSLQRGNNHLMGLQGMGDDAPLSANSQHNVSAQESLLYEDEFEMATNARAPSSYSDQMSRKIMEGKNWPSLPKSYELRSRTLRELEHESNMTPSARAFSEKVLYHIMRNIKMCPEHVRQHLPFEELMISRVIASNRSVRIYIVWSTVTPAARIRIEPLLEKLNNWIAQVITFNIKTTPNIPVVTWVYDAGNLPTALPKDLKRELRNVYSNMNTSNANRVEYLKSLDTLSHRIKEVPWFMPYLWSKENKMANRRAMGDDLRVTEQRKKGGDSRRPGYVSQGT